MKTTDVRNLTWQEIRGTLGGMRELIHAWLLTHGPATTKTIAGELNLNLLSVRPRVSELCAWGFAECVGTVDRWDGLYRAVTVYEAQARHEESLRESQLNLLL